MIYTLTLNPALDYIMTAESLEFGAINRAVRQKLCYGGKGINVSAVLTRLGVKNIALGLIAGENGRLLEKLLTAEGIESDFCRLAQGNTRMNVKINADKEMDVNAVGPAVSDGDMDRLFNKLDMLHSGDFLVLAGSVPSLLGSKVYGSIMQRLENRGVRFAVDAAGECLLNTLKYRPFIIKPNHHELGDVFQTKINNMSEARRYARRLQERGARNVLVSFADKGALLLTEHGEVLKTANALGTFVSSVGCGDSMLAGFLAGYFRRTDYAYALQLGTACGNATAYTEGLADLQEIQRICHIFGINAKE